MDSSTPIITRKLAPTFGLEIKGLRIAGDMASETFSTVLDLFHTHHILVLKTGGLEPADQVAFSKLFGPLEVHAERRFIHPSHPEIFCVGNAAKDGVPIAALSVGVEQWHVDSSYRRVPSTASLFYGHTVPPEGADTAFADAVAAYQGLPEQTKQRIEGLRAVHDYEYFDGWLRVLNPDRRPYTDELRRDFPPVSHPLVRTHPVTGRKSLLICPAVTSHIEGLDFKAGRALIDALAVHMAQSKYVYRHRWTQGDLVMWDNRCTLHTATPFDHTRYQRLMYRTTIAGA